MKKWIAASMLALVATTASPVRAVDLDAYVKRDSFTDIKISPNGDYFAATVLLEDQTILVVMDRESKKVTASLKQGTNGHIGNFYWATPERLLITATERFGDLETPRWTGELFAMNADGSKIEMLSGFRVNDGGTGTMIKPKSGSDKIAAYPIPTIANDHDDRSVLVATIPYGNRDPYTFAEKMDIFSGRRSRVATVPVKGASFGTDNEGVVRFAWGSNADRVRRLYYRPSASADWSEMAVERDGAFEWPIGFSADNSIAYLQVEHARGTDSIDALEVSTGKRQTVLRDKVSDPTGEVIYKEGTRIPLGVFFMDGRPRTEFIDADSPEARLYRSLEAAFAGNTVRITSRTTDGRLALVHVSSDSNPGEFYLFDTVAKQASFVIANRAWFDPQQQAVSEPFSFAARDGMTLHGYVTRPRGSESKALPLVVLPHGGPYFVQDTWGFDDEAQLLADAGYAVLQLNYRGSGGYGRAYASAGAREWGGSMQDDLTDATLWAVERGIADRSRICIYGASYGGYAAMMGAVREPDLYKCAAGYVGVYDLPKMKADDSRASLRLENWSNEWLGDGASLASTSPNRMADRIKVPVFLAAGGEDQRAPIKHSEMMEQALRRVGVPVETLYYDTEGHGFYKEEHRREFYTRLLAFLARSLGGEVATTGSTQQGAAGN